jgi:hypothetical protein
MVGLFRARGTAESDAADAARARSRSRVWLAAGMAIHLGVSDRPSVRSHVPGTRRDRAQADEAGIKKAKPPIETPSIEPAPAPAGESAYGPSSKGVRPMNRLRRTSRVHATWLGCWTRGGHVRSVYAPEPPLLFSCGRGNSPSAMSRSPQQIPLITRIFVSFVPFVVEIPVAGRNEWWAQPTLRTIVFVQQFRS